ncbi:MAG: GNAT family N-acetyltransferase [Solobacterium sp.]|nr:GNAT family N-acetyltransferase [Solobacterium sp.]
MIIKATDEMTVEIRRIWKECFPEEDPRYIDYYFKNQYDPDNCYVNLVNNHIVSILVRNTHALMFNERALRVSMLIGIATLPQYRKQGHMRDLMEVVLDACEHTELITLLRTEMPKLYEPLGFRTIYRRQRITLERKDVKRIAPFGCAYDPQPLELLKVYSNFIKRFNGFYARDLAYFVNYKKEITARGGKIVAYYNGKNQIMGYAVMVPEGNELKVEEMIYLDSTSLIKLLNAALSERLVVQLHLSAAEDLSRAFPEAKIVKYDSVMARLNDRDLFAKLYGVRCETVEQAFALSERPLNLNEFA